MIPIPATIALELTLEHGQTAYEPGGRLAGVAAWRSEVAPRGIELRLSWRMRGRSGSDFKIADSVMLPDPLASERRPFILTLPAAPYSLRGHLVSLAWSLELVASPGEEKAGIEIVIAPSRRPLILEPAPAPAPAPTPLR